MPNNNNKNSTMDSVVAGGTVASDDPVDGSLFLISGSNTMTSEELLAQEAAIWCDSDERSGEQDDDTCPVEPDVSFGDALRDRAYWLVGLLILQSASGIILARNEALLQHHPFSKSLIREFGVFLTVLDEPIEWQRLTYPDHDSPLLSVLQSFTF